MSAPWNARLREVLTRDHFPDLDRALRRAIWNPLGGLTLAFVASLLCALFLHPRAFVLAFGLLTVMALGVAWPWLTLTGLRGRAGYRQRRAREGESVGGWLEVRNLLPWSAWGVELCDTPSSLAAVRGWRTASAEWTFTPNCRGVYPLVLTRLRTGFPFGLFHPSRPCAVEQELIVWPRTFPIADLPDAAGENELEGAVTRNRPGSHGDLLGVRPYRRGDALRRVHWQQSAKHDRLIVREVASTARPVVLVALDADPAVHAGDGPDGSREWAVRLAASVCESWLLQGAEVGLLCGGRFVRPAGGEGQRRDLLDELARLGESGGDVLADANWRGFLGTRLLVTTDRRLAGGAPGDVILAVLRAAAFAGGTEPPITLTVRPWLWLDGPKGVRHAG